MSEDGIDPTVFGLTAIAMFVAGGLVLYFLVPHPISYSSLAAIFAGGCFASAWIAFVHWHIGGEVNA